MRLRILTAISFGFLAAACQSSSEERTYVQAPHFQPGQMETYKEVPARGSTPYATPPRTGGRGPVAWTHNGYSYDQWGNLISAPR